MNSVKVYSFDENTKEYIGSELADIDIFTNEVILPRNATEVKPLEEVDKGKTLVFENNRWVAKVDNRGKTYFLSDGSFHTIKYIGDLLPEDALSEKPDIRTLEELKKDVISCTDKEHAKVLNTLTGSATIEERDTWQTKAIASEAFKNGTISISQKLMLQTEADMCEISIESLVDIILQKYEIYQKLIGLASGLRLKGKRLIEECTTKEEVHSTVASLKKERENVVAQFKQ